MHARFSFVGLVSSNSIILLNTKFKAVRKIKFDKTKRQTRQTTVYRTSKHELKKSGKNAFALSYCPDTLVLVEIDRFPTTFERGFENESFVLFYFILF